MTEADLKSGVIITCKSTGKDKFKIVFFDGEGHVTMVEESQQSKRDSTANLYVVPYGRYNLMESMPLSMMKHLEDDVPPVFMILDTYDKDIKVGYSTYYIHTHTLHRAHTSYYHSSSYSWILSRQIDWEAIKQLSRTKDS